MSLYYVCLEFDIGLFYKLNQNKRSLTYKKIKMVCVFWDEGVGNKEINTGKDLPTLFCNQNLDCFDAHDHFCIVN